MRTISPTKKTELLELAESVLERLQNDRLTRVSLLHLDELPSMSGVYLAVSEDNTVLYVGKANDFTDRCNISTHHKLPSAVERGAVFLYIANVPSEQAWYVEQWLIDQLAPSLNASVSRWWIEKIAIPRKVGRPKRLTPTDRVNYNMDTIVRNMLRDIARRNGRNEGAQIEQLVVFYEAIEQLNLEGKKLSFDAINARVREIWADINARHDAAGEDS